MSARLLSLLWKASLSTRDYEIAVDAFRYAPLASARASGEGVG